MDNRLYLSILQAPASGGSVDIVLATYGASSDIVLTLSATGLLSTDSEINIAKKIFDQFLIQLSQNSARYSPPAEGLVSLPPASFQLTRTDHVICFWSQTAFSLEVSDNTPGVVMSIKTTPTLTTVPEARNLAVIIGQDFSSLSNTQLAILLDNLSDEIVSVTNNNFVSSTYLLDVWVNQIHGYQLPQYPVQKIDNPLTADPWTIWSINSYRAVDITSRYLIQEDGWVMYRYAQDLVHDDINPFAMNNEFRITWVAGFSKIPMAVKMASVKISTFYINYSIYEELKGGTSSVKFKDEEREKKAIFLTLSGFFR